MREERTQANRGVGQPEGDARGGEKTVIRVRSRTIRRASKWPISSWIFWTALLWTLPAPRAWANGLEGCTDPAALAKAAESLRHSDWRTLTVARVKMMWPTELVGVDCDKDACTSVESRGRIIRGRYECSETFFFAAKHESDGTAPTELTNLVIQYSSNNRLTIIQVARSLAKALGVSEEALATIGREASQSLHWENPGQASISGLGIEIRQDAKIWTLTLNLSRYPK